MKGSFPYLVEDHYINCLGYAGFTIVKLFEGSGFVRSSLEQTCWKVIQSFYHLVYFIFKLCTPVHLRIGIGKMFYNNKSHAGNEYLIKINIYIVCIIQYFVNLKVTGKTFKMHLCFNDTFTMIYKNIKTLIQTIRQKSWGDVPFCPTTWRVCAVWPL